MKKIVLIILMLLISGCSSNYDLKISNNSFDENINFVVPSSSESVTDNDTIEDDNRLNSIFKESIASVTTEDEFFKKEISKFDNYTIVELVYKHDEDSFKNATSINLCFEYPELKFEENYYINLQGAFYCLYSDSIDIKIKTSNKVYSNNADEINGDTYIWHINESNVDYVDIKIEIDKGIPNEVYVVIVFIGVLLVLLGYIGFKLYKKYKYENKI